MNPVSPQAVSHERPDAQKKKCFHCGLTIPDNVHLSVDVEGARQPMCCKGCQAVCQSIVDAGLTSFYQHRDKKSLTASEVVPDFLKGLKIYDNPQVQKSFVNIEDEHVRQASLILEGIVCAACVWLNEKHIAAIPGVIDVQVNYTTHRARVRWDDRKVDLSDILEAISRIGYKAHPYDPGRQQQIIENERRQHLRRLGLAGVLGMQVMMISVALYFGAWKGMDADIRTFLHWLTFLLTIPVVIFSAQPFFKTAYRDLQKFHAGMDVPISLGILIAFIASAWATTTNKGEVYFDSVVMFTFFLLSARYFELMARKRAAEDTESLVRMVPPMATRLDDNGDKVQENIVAVVDLQPGDKVLIRPGENVPADGHVISGHSSVDESLLTGESLPVSKTEGDWLTGGCYNVESPLTMMVEQVGQDTRLSSIIRLLERAQTEKPQLTRIADRVAGWFVLSVLVLAVLVASYWLLQQSTHWLAITLAVLVVTCPCALSLATPAAMTAATGFMTRLGLLTTRGHAIEALAHVTDIVFDKTGTLTIGQPRLLKTEILSSDMNSNDCLQLAAALERQSEHPYARILVEAAQHLPRMSAENILNRPGSGIEGEIQNCRYFIGSPAYIQSATGQQITTQHLQALHEGGRTLIILANGQQLLAAFVMGDTLRENAADVVRELQIMGKKVHLFTGDHEAAASHIATQLGIRDVVWELKPEDKLARVRALQENGATVAMVGDGINDAPVLAGAQVSLAMGGGTQLAMASADMILLSGQLSQLVNGIKISRRTLAIIRQNMGWAIGYNLIALPAAALGYVQPWMAALGMSMSSLLVVLNALRLTRLKI